MLVVLDVVEVVELVVVVLVVVVAWQTEMLTVLSRCTCVPAPGLWLSTCRGARRRRQLVSKVVLATRPAVRDGRLGRALSLADHARAPWRSCRSRPRG